MLDLTTEAAGQLTMVEVEYYQATATCSGPHSEAKRPDLCRCGILTLSSIGAGMAPSVARLAPGTKPQ